MGKFEIELEYSFFVLFAPFRRVGRGHAFSKYLAGECGSFPSTPLNVPGSTGSRIYSLRILSFQLTILPPLGIVAPPRQ